MASKKQGAKPQSNSSYGVVETLFRTYTKKGTGDTVNGDQETGALFCYRYFVWRPEKEPGE